MKRVLVLGSKGMLAQAVLDTFWRHGDEFELFVASRTDRRYITADKWISLNAESQDNLLIDCNRFDFIINCIGYIKPYINDLNSESVQKAIAINATFPHRLIANNLNARVIQIATDCVFSGKEDANHHFEDSPHNPTDVYGKTKSLGEVHANNFFNLRTSIVGREYFYDKSLLSWFLKHQEGATITGYLNHFWNGITNVAFAKICVAIVRNCPTTGIFLPNVLHVVPSDYINKYQLLCLFQKRFGTKFNILQTQAPNAVNRILQTSHPEVVSYLWKLAGYSPIPSIAELVNELI